ncbi:hypothetical protein ACQPYA_15945 [Micromonospora sp. CA-263727]|uniref:hypothetical protein n=1 Tax=Micromonospora sp. CA-263727 TaxID=3239967 RepID=UPI003D8B5E7E
MMPWPTSEQPAQSITPRATLTAHPVDPLPPRITPPAPPPARRRIPNAARVFVALVLAVGSPWGNRQLQDWLDPLPREDGPAGLALELTRTLGYGLAWPRWDAEPASSRFVGYWLAENLRTLLFIAITVWLLGRLVALPAPTRPYQALAVLGASVASAVTATLGGIVFALLVDDAGPLTDLRPLTLSAVGGGVIAGLAYGLLLIGLMTRSRAGDRRADAGPTR